MTIKEMLLDEDCNRCEGDLPEPSKLTPPKQVPKKVPIEAGEAVFEGGGSDLEKEFKELLG